MSDLAKNVAAAKAADRPLFWTKCLLAGLLLTAAVVACIAVPAMVVASY